MSVFAKKQKASPLGGHQISPAKKMKMPQLNVNDQDNLSTLDIPI
jgi:hypothetical protein